MLYGPELRNKVTAAVCDNSARRFPIVDNNFTTPVIVGYYRGIEISCETGAKPRLNIIGVTFSTDSRNRYNRYNKAFPVDEMDEIRDYIDDCLDTHEGGP